MRGRSFSVKNTSGVIQIKLAFLSREKSEREEENSREPESISNVAAPELQRGKIARVSKIDGFGGIDECSRSPVFAIPVRSRVTFVCFSGYESPFRARCMRLHRTSGSGTPRSCDLRDRPRPRSRRTFSPLSSS